MTARLSLREALARLPGPVDPATAESIGETSGHDVYRLRVGARLAVLRITDRGTDMSLALAAQRQAAAAGLAPAVLLAAPDAGIVLSDYAAGEPLCATGLSAPGAIEAVAALLKRLHALPSLGVALDLEAAADRYVARCPPARRAQAADVRDELADSLSRTADRPAVPCHNDPVAGNFVAGRALVLLDWEYAADNDPLFDLAVVAEHHQLDAPTRERLLFSYDAAELETNLRLLPAWEAVYRSLNWLWCAARRDDPSA